MSPERIHGDSTRRRARVALWLVIALLGACVALVTSSAPAGAEGNEAPGNPVAFRSIASGETHACAIADDGTVRCWGGNSSGQLGQGDTDNRGDEPDELGDTLPPVDLGTGHTATAITAGSSHTCALLDTGEVMCWGWNADGQLGQGDTDDRGDEPDELGDTLPPVDLGTGHTATAITAGTSHTCALLDDGSVKCWGANLYGQLGQGDASNRGDQADELGDALPAVDLGTGHTASAITAGNSHTCALLDDGTVKCWGYNGDGELGQGDTDGRGDVSDELGDALPAVDLGAGHTATAITAGGLHTCALLDDSTVTCWGWNNSGQLGQGDTDNRGDEPDELGDTLPPVDLGTGHTATAITTGFYHSCAALDDGTVRCWGSNDSGRLGQGDTEIRGDGAGELGDALPAIDVPPVDVGTPPDATDPTVTITTPADDATYVRGAAVTVDYSCDDDVAIATCTGDVADGAALDTSTAGPHTFTVTAVDSAGNDTVVTNDYTVTVPLCLGQTVTVDLTAEGQPTNGPDVILGTPGDDTIRALGGDDVVCGLGGNDTLRAGGGLDRVYGGAGNDTAYAGPGGGLLAGNAGSDALHGGRDNDTLRGGAGDDTLTGGPGNDLGDGGPDTDTCTLTPGRDTARACEG